MINFTENYIVASIKNAELERKCDRLQCELQQIKVNHEMLLVCLKNLVITYDAMPDEFKKAYSPAGLPVIRKHLGNAE